MVRIDLVSSVLTQNLRVGGLRYKLEFVGHSAELWQCRGLRLPHHVTAMDLHCDFADADITGNLFAEAAPHDLDRDLALSARRSDP
jgi:hypothetical protein